MMHVRFKKAWQGKMHKQNYKLSGAQYATLCILAKHHINYLVLSRLCTQQYKILLNMARGEAYENYLSREV